MKAPADGGERGSRGRGFPTTLWTAIASARDGDPGGLEQLCCDYRGPVVAFLRGLGHSEHDAEDLAQGFFASLLGRPFLEELAPEKGRFRTFVIRCLRHCVSDERDRATALKRGGGMRRVAIDTESGEREGGSALEIPDTQPSPDGCFQQAWGRTVLERAHARLERECAKGRRLQMLAELEPVLFDDSEAPSYRTIGERLGMTEGAVTTGAKRIRDRLRWLIRDEVSRTLADESECDAELRELMTMFARR